MSAPVSHSEISPSELGPHSRLTVDLEALAANYRQLRELAAPAECGAVVKADGYGLGAEPVAGRLLSEGCRHFFVAQTLEGVRLRRAGLAGLEAARVSVLGGLAGAPPALLASHDLTPVLSTPSEIAVWTETARRANRGLAGDPSGRDGQ